jgi:transcriptional regulator with XRE-family HTH domain
MSASPKSEIDSFVISKVKERRVLQKMSQSELATHLDVSDGFIGMVESIRYPSKYSVEQLNRLAIILGCSIKDFFPDKPIDK